jgi:hypothetical protein
LFFFFFCGLSLNTVVVFILFSRTHPQDELTASVMKYKDDVQFQTLMQGVTMQQERHFSALGIQAAGR